MFISNDLDTDIHVLNIFLLGSAVNSARKSIDIFGRDLDLETNLAQEIGIFVKKLNTDWENAFLYYKPLMELMYLVGKKEKIAWAGPENLEGIVVGE